MTARLDSPSDIFTIFGFGSWPEPPDAVPLRILGLAKRPETETAVKAAFRARLRVVHPDILSFAAVPPLQDAALALAMERPEVAELAWARDVLLRKVPAVTAGTCAPEGIHEPSRYKCSGCGTPWTDWRTRLRERGVDKGHCDRCAAGRHNERQREWRRQGRAGRDCESCGDTFTPPRSDARYCSPACRQKAYRERQHDNCEDT